MATDQECLDAHIQNSLEHAMCHVRDRLQIIVDGEIKRGRCLDGQSVGYGHDPGKRKLKLIDAKTIALHSITYLNDAIWHAEELRTGVKRP